jgi:hypothetical protein
MVRYFYAWTPLVLVGTVAILALPWLAVIALIAALIVAFAAVGALAWAIVWAMVSAVHALSRSVPRRSWARVTQTHGLR